MLEYRVERWLNPGEPVAEELAAIMRAEGYSVFKWSDGPGAAYADHQHGEDQSHWIISGTMELTVQVEGLIQLGPGDRDFMPAGTMHSARVKGNKPVVYLIGAKR